MIIKKISEIEKDDLKTEVCIREKIIGHRISFRVAKNGNISFYGKKSKKPLTLIDRFMSDLYEHAIKKIIRNSNNVVIDDATIFRAYTINDRIILTDASKLGMKIHDEAYLTSVANLLKIEVQTPVFTGILPIETITAIEAGESYDKIFSTFSSKPQDEISGGVILKFKSGARYKAQRRTSEIFPKHDTTVFEMVAADAIQFITNEVDVSSIPIHSSNNEDIRFIDVALRLFEKFKDNENLQKPAWPKFLENAGSITKSLITYKPISVYINNNKDNEYLLRIFMLVITGRIRSRGILTEEDEFASSLIFSFIKDYAYTRGIVDINTLKNILK